MSRQLCVFAYMPAALVNVKTYSYRSLFFLRVCPASLLIENE